MQKLILLFAMFSLFQLSCVEPSKPIQPIDTPHKSATNPNIELGDIYQNYTSEPRSQFQIDENLIIDYIASNGLDTKRAENGLYYIINDPGEGPLLQRGSPVKADYKGYFLDGKVFDSSYGRGKPIRFTIGQMAAGWDQGLTYVSRGANITLLLPSFLGYGEEGFSTLVPPNSVLIFEIDIKKEAY